jgi:hypothetical protein
MVKEVLCPKTKQLNVLERMLVKANLLAPKPGNLFVRRWIISGRASTEPGLQNRPLQ